MYVDQDQSLGTLHGLQNKLLLRDDKNRRRRLFLPEAQVSYSKITEHPVRVSVSVAKDMATKLHVLDVDTMLGRLVDNGSLHGKLFLAYIHALTSFCLPDPLTGKTGTEQALSILSSAAVRSFSQLSESDADLLVKIARLTPKRNYYPVHLQDMQEITWDNNLSFLSQRGEFVKIVSTLLNQANTTRILYPEVKFELPDIDVGSWFLHSRDLIRSSTFKVDSFGAEQHATSHDICYASRDRDQSSQRAQDVYSLSKLVFSGLNTRHWPALDTGYLWKAMSGLSVVYAPHDGLRLSKLKYDSSFITKSDIHSNEVDYMNDKNFVLQHWPALHQFLARRQDASDNRLTFMVWLATMGWGHSIDTAVLQSLALMLTTHTVAQVAFPASLTATVSPIVGCVPTSNGLTGNHSRTCPEAQPDRRG